MKGADFHTSKVKQNTMKKYMSRVCKILNANLLGDSIMTVICAYVVPILCYTFGVMKWTRAELHSPLSAPPICPPQTVLGLCRAYIDHGWA
eukprot:5613922-Ditylum_brightwellii.AAC.1